MISVNSEVQFKNLDDKYIQELVVPPLGHMTLGVKESHFSQFLGSDMEPFSES